MTCVVNGFDSAESVAVKGVFEKKYFKLKTTMSILNSLKYPRVFKKLEAQRLAWTRSIQLINRSRRIFYAFPGVFPR